MNPDGLEAYVVKGDIPCGRLSNGDVLDFFEDKPGYQYYDEVEDVSGGVSLKNV